MPLVRVKRSTKIVGNAHAQGTPMVIYTGMLEGLTKRFPQAVIVSKPVPSAHLLKSIAKALSRH